MKGTILNLNDYRGNREEYVFKFSKEKFKLKNGKNIYLPLISLYDKQTDLIMMTPAYERWYIDGSDIGVKAWQTFAKRAYYICVFLNYVLENTNHNSLHEVSEDDMWLFEQALHVKQSGKKRDAREVKRGIALVKEFLGEFYRHNKDMFEFHYNPDEWKLEKDEKSVGKKYPVNHSAVRGKKFRFICESYLDMILLEAQKYDPMLVLGIAFQAYAGLREGEVVNLTRRKIKTIYAGFGRIKTLEIDLKDEAPFARAHSGKTEFGSIKKYRTQEVYGDFVNQIVNYYKEHERYLEVIGADSSPDAPLFIDKRGNPMTVSTYCDRVRKLFRKHFVPHLEKYCDRTNEWPKHAPYIEVYKKNYPGAHMFRHWFTMYLINTMKGDQDVASKVMRWRGDSSVESMSAYISVYGDIIDKYQSTVQAFQRNIWYQIIQEDE